jgi:hypothetical protein
MEHCPTATIFYLTVTVRENKFFLLCEVTSGRKKNLGDPMLNYVSHSGAMPPVNLRVQRQQMGIPKFLSCPFDWGC